MKKHEYLDQELNSTCFTLRENGVCLDSLFGQNLGSSGNETDPARVAGLLSLSAGSNNFNSDQLILRESLFEEDSASMTWQTDNNELLLRSDWRYCRKTGIWLRSDTLTNESNEDVVIRRCLARFSLSPGSYELYSQGSRWCGENQGSWQALERGGVVLRSEGGRTTQGGTPFVCIRDSDSKEALIFHIIPKGNWIIKVTAGTAEGDSPSFAVVELGMADTHLFYSLAPGRSIELPQILIQKAPKGEPHLAAPNLHVYLLENIFAANEESVPIVYNTWFDDFEFLAVPRLRRQLKAAKEIGCEVFVVDAGWYGGAAGSWSEQTGDWREKEDAAFEGRMADFAEEVRSEGLGFGLWMEPERLCKSVPIRIEHPEW
ncbi:MAG: hypothetical protein HN368_18595, partial [Spirochaetales bacterium]|nr:hypothetical protein [Spirochaetales bacterium]